MKLFKKRQPTDLEVLDVLTIEWGKYKNYMAELARRRATKPKTMGQIEDDLTMIRIMKNSMNYSFDKILELPKRDFYKLVFDEVEWNGFDVFEGRIKKRKL